MTSTVCRETTMLSLLGIKIIHAEDLLIDGNHGVYGGRDKCASVAGYGNSGESR